ncbi:MAG TPA: sulfurtransferase [Solirubrobacteraceae bacterium]|jgi:thiosulfate/3-mercaptopyruvate sulfurtransferase
MSDGPLITPQELHDQLERTTLLDVRWSLKGPPGIDDYLTGHIPGAVFVDLDRELAAPPGPGGRHPLPDAWQFTSAMRAAGVSRSRAVVVYDAATSMAAARAWWLLRYFGHDDVAVLDGGFAAWTAAGYAVATTPVVAGDGDFVASPGGLPVVDAAGAARLATAGVLLDSRAPERFRGDTEPVDPVAGHVPGARNRPASANVDAAGRLQPPGTLREAFAQLGIDEAAEVGAYCGSGVSAAHQVLALELAGYRAALYAGSWSEWITDPDRPVARGPG